MNIRLLKIFEIMSFYDNFRWNNEENYNFINFYDSKLNADEKLLTHWLCYITDRQMPFKIIWDVGGFVISELVVKIRKYKSIDLLNPENKESFIKKENNGNKYYLLSMAKANDLIKTNYQQYIVNGKVKFKSRFFPSDYFAILNTLFFLQDIEYKFSNFFKEIYEKNKNKEDYIKRILFSLYLITYYKLGQPKSLEIANFKENIRLASNRKSEIERILNNENKFEFEYQKFSRTQIYSQKRAWCSLRDYLKSPYFKVCFKEALSKEGLASKDFDLLFSLQSLRQLELPGDVWNNNSLFKSCILKGSAYENDKRTLNKILREFFNKNQEYFLKQSCYPEQFDITFDFVPRMCEQNNCDICPVNRLDNNKNYFNKICLDDVKKFCPVILVSCNYKGNCVSKDKCILNFKEVKDHV